MRKLFKKPWIFEYLVIFIFSLTPLLWFTSNSVIVGHDNVFALDPVMFLQGRLTTWIGHGFGQGQELIMGTALVHFIDAIPSFLGFPIQATQKIIYVFWFFMMGISCYVLASTLNPKSTIFKLSAVILYQFNFFILQAWWIGERTKFSAYVALPLIITSFIKVYKKEWGVAKAFVFNSLVLFFFNAGGLFGIPLYGGLFIAILVFVIFYGLFGIFEKNFALIKQLLLLVIFTTVGYVLVNSYFVFPALTKLFYAYSTGLSSVGGVGGLIEWARVISANTSFLNLFRLQGIAEWYDNPEHPYAFYYLKKVFFVGLSFIFPLLTFLSLVTSGDREKRKNILYFFIVFLVGIFLSSGTHKPSGFIYEFFITNIPGFAAFRSPYFKFASAIFLSVSILIPYVLDSLRGRVKQAAFVLLISFVLCYHFPFFTGNIFSWKKGYSTRLNVPSYVLDFGKWLNTEKPKDSRVLMLPPNDPSFRYSAYDWGYLSFQSFPTLLSNEPVVINNDRLNEDETTMYLLLQDAIRNNDKQLTYSLAHLLQIEFFVIQKDTSAIVRLQSFSDAAAYEKSFISFGFPLVKHFGRWDVYKIPFPLQSKILSTNGADMVTGNTLDIRNYFDFAGKDNLFVLEDTNNTPDFFAKTLATKFYTPECIHCGGRIRPFVRFPDRNILPNSTLYPLVLLNEELSLHKESPKQVIYDYLGITLKRVTEMKEIVANGDEIGEEMVNRYDGTLRQIMANFEKIPVYRDKLGAAGDIYYYMDEEKDLISSIMGVYVAGGENLIKLDYVLQSMQKLQNQLKPYLFNYDDLNNRLYELTIQQSDTYSPFVKLDSFQEVFKDQINVSLVVDGNIRKDVKLDLAQSTEKWITFGKFFLEKGYHKFLFSFPQAPNLTSEFKAEKAEFSENRSAGNCFVSDIQGFSTQKTYKVKIVYFNDFSESLMFYVWEDSDLKKNLTSSHRLFTNFAQNTFTHVIAPRSDTKKLKIGLCASTLTGDLLKRKVSMTLQEFITPSIFVVPKVLNDYAEKKVSFTKESPTKYTVKLSTKYSPVILSFLERYDDGWMLSEFGDSHFKIGGYANGWVIDKPGIYKLELVYKPQKFFMYGSMISVMSVVGGLIYLLLERIKRKELP